MSKCIVVEGPDGSGKSTLLALLEKQLGVKAFHAGGPPKSALELRRRCEIEEGRVLMDRWSAISDQVYGPILRGSNLIPRDEMMYYVLEYRPQIIYCRPPNYILERNLGSLDNLKAHKPKDHCDAVRAEYWRIVDAYDLLMRQIHGMGLIVTTYDYTGENI